MVWAPTFLWLFKPVSPWGSLTLAGPPCLHTQVLDGQGGSGASPRLLSLRLEGGTWLNPESGQARSVLSTPGPEGPYRRSPAFPLLHACLSGSPLHHPGYSGLPFNRFRSSTAPPSEVEGRRAVSQVVTAQLPGCQLLVLLWELSTGWWGCPMRVPPSGESVYVCGRAGEAFQARGEFSGSLATLGPFDLTSGAHPSVFLQGPVPRTNQRLSVVLL